MIGGAGTGDARPGPAGPGQPTVASEHERPIQAGFERFLSLTRLLALIPVLFLLFDAASSFIYGTDIMVRSVTGLIGEPAQVGGRLGVFLVVMDTFLVGATLMVAAFGFYELFVVRNPGRRYRLPGWLRMSDLEDLKARVVSMLILVAAITFVDRTVESQDEQETLFLGIGISIIIIALTIFLWFGKRNGLAAAPGPAVVTGGGSDDGPAGGGATGVSPAAGGESSTAVGMTGSSGRGGHQANDTSARANASAATDLAVAGDAGTDQAATDRSARLIAILGVARRDGDWANSPARALAVAGYARVDLRDAEFDERELKIRATAVLGVVSITVPPGTRVVESGVAVLGLRLRRTGPPSEPAGRRLAVSGLSVFSVVRVRPQPLALARPAVTALDVVRNEPSQNASRFPGTGSRAS